MIMISYIQVALGLLKPMTGKVKISSIQNIPGEGVGCMPQSLSLHSYFSCHEILWYYAVLGGVNPSDIEARVKRILGFLKLESKASVRLNIRWQFEFFQEEVQITNLSGGQQRRLSLACSIIHSPELLILDEPTVGTDPLLRVEIWAALRALSSMGNTSMVTSSGNYVKL